MADTSHTRGDSFIVTGQHSSGDFTGWTGRSQVRSKEDDTLLSELAFEWLDATVGAFRVQALDTRNWPVGKDVVFDVQFTSPAHVVVSSKLVTITVLRDVTKEDQGDEL